MSQINRNGLRMFDSNCHVFFNPCQLKSNSNLLNFNPNPTNFMRVVSVFYLLVVLKIATTRIIDCVMLMVKRIG